MQLSDFTAQKIFVSGGNPADVTKCLQSALEQSRAEVALKQQFGWSRRKLLGRKSEKRIIENPRQLDLSVLPGDVSSSAEPVPTEEITYLRKPKQRDTHEVIDADLRFGLDVLVEVFELSAHEPHGPDADRYQVVDYWISCRLAQRPGSYMVLEFRSPVLQYKPLVRLIDVLSPTPVLTGSRADAGLVAGILVDKFYCHLSLHSQHQPPQHVGITLNCRTPTSHSQQAIEFVRPVYDDRRRYIRRIRVPALDETQIEAARQQLDELQATWHWPICGKDDELCFTWSTSRDSPHTEQQLADFTGILLSDSCAANDRCSKARSQVNQSQCHPQTRRYLNRVNDHNPAAREVLTRIDALYLVELKVHELGIRGEAKRDGRRCHVRPIVKVFVGWFLQQHQRMNLLNSGSLARALVYAENQQAKLKVHPSAPDMLYQSSSAGLRGRSDGAETGAKRGQDKCGCC